MEGPQVHQPAPAPHPQHTPQQVAAPQAPPPYNAPPPSRVEIGGRVVRLLAARALWAGEQGWRLVRPNLGWVLLTALLVGAISFLSLLLLLPRLGLGASEPAADSRVSLIQPAPAVVDFLRGQQTYDADLMWESFSPALREDLEGRDFTRERLAEQMETERQAGQRYRKYDYIGGVELRDRQRMYFYVVEVQAPAQQGTGTRSVSFVFTVGSDGKIVSIE